MPKDRVFRLNVKDYSNQNTSSTYHMFVEEVGPPPPLLFAHGLRELALSFILRVDEVGGKFQRMPNL